MVHLGNFNPRPPCGRRRSSISMPGASRQFQSSLPMREATQDLLRRALTIKHFNPRLPCGRRLGSVSPVAKSSSFQSPPPMRGATVFGRDAAPGSYISTHAPHAGSDEQLLECLIKPSNFNPRSPCGERLLRLWWSTPWITNFNPRSPCGKRHCHHHSKGNQGSFQSPPPMREATREPFGWRYESEFQPTLPMRGATSIASSKLWVSRKFQPTLPMRGATGKEVEAALYEGDFNPRSPCGERHSPLLVLNCRSDDFNPRSPCGERRAAA